MQRNDSDVVENLVRLAPHTEVAHHIPGRIRLKILPSGLKLVRGMDVQGLFGSIPGTVNIRIKSLSGSVVIEHDNTKLLHGIWENLRELRMKPELAEEVKKRLLTLWDVH